MSDKAKYSYLAGIIDGEGCLTIGAGRKGNVTNFNSLIMVKNTSFKLIQWLQNSFGGNYYKIERPGDNCKPAYLWRFLKKKDIELLLLAIIPYLIIKRQQAIVLLEFVRLPRICDPQKRAELHTKIQLLNRRGLDSVTTNMQDTVDTVKIESELYGDVESGLAVTQVSQ